MAPDASLLSNRNDRSAARPASSLAGAQWPLRGSRHCPSGDKHPPRVTRARASEFDLTQPAGNPTIQLPALEGVDDEIDKNACLGRNERP
jgi:hypothetical protein